MSTQEVVHPATREVPVAGGQFKVTISPWTMAQRAHLKPKIIKLLARANVVQTDPSAFKFSDLFADFEDELCEIAQATAKFPPGKTWDNLLWEDLPILVQAIWEVCVVRGDAGIAGKVAGALGKALSALLSDRLTRKSSLEESSGASPSSLGGGAPTSSDSVTL